MKAKDIFIDFEKKAIEWAKQYQIAKVGDIVTSNLRGKKPKKLKISSVSVTIGRNARTTQKTLVIQYIGRRIKSNGEFIDELGTGKFLTEFVTEDGRTFNHSENEVTETANDIGVSFNVDFDPEAKEKYPYAYLSYNDSYNGFYYSR
jgi:activator of HSP90 ATPase